MADLEGIRNLRPDWFPETTAAIARRELERQERWTDTAALCPECGRPTIRRIGGEWCRWCRGYIVELVLRSPATVAGGDTARRIRTIKNIHVR
jgi:ribosomal protein L37AE/L43A